MPGRYARITGWGKYAPPRVLTNADLEKMVDTSDEWIVTRTGIRERHIASGDETTATMSVAAARQALAVAGLEPNDLDLIIVATSSPDYLTPPVSSMVQADLGANRAGAFMLAAGCSGFVYGLVTAQQFIAAGAYRRILVVGAELISRATDWHDRNTCVLFGDGAGAVVVEASDQPTGLLAFELGSDGTDYDALILPGGGVKAPPTHETVAQNLHTLRMDGKRIFKFATRVMADSVRRVIQQSGLAWDDIELVIPHQANARIIELVQRMLGLPNEKVMLNVDRYGNTSAASIPLALCEAVEQGRLKTGDHAVLVSIGSGFTWATAVLHWQPQEPAAIPVTNWPI
ncbi:MAG: ketoacyl-ACP synthase III, partial [Anaerolineae bacterium]|nr:ketoacyl-ACP synthase III [Anaerolineae bacterium]